MPNAPYRVIIQAPIPILDPVVGPASHKDLILSQVCQTLVNLDDDFQPSPSLARSWHISEANLTITFTLDDQVFHNGKKVTAFDVQQSLARGILHRLPSADRIRNWHQVLDGSVKIEEVLEIVSDQEIRIHLADSGFDTYLKSLTVPDNSIIYRGEVTNPLIGSGAYKILNASADGTLYQLESVDPHPTNRPRRIEFVQVDPKDGLSALEEDKVDEYVTGFLTVQPRVPKNAHEIAVFFPIIRGMFLSTRSKVFSSRENRREFAALIPRAEIAAKVYPNSLLTNSIIPSGLMGFDNDFQSFDWKQSFYQGSTRKVVIGSYMQGEPDQLFTQLINTKEMKALGWNIEIRSYPSHESMVKALKEGILDGHLFTLLAKYYDPISIMQMFSYVVSPDTYAKPDHELEALINSLWTTKEGHRTQLYTLTAAYIQSEGYGIPLIEVQVRKFVRKNAPTFINPSRIHFWNHIGTPKSLAEDDVFRRLNQSFSLLRNAQGQLKREKEVSALARRVSHDIRSPLTALRLLERKIEFDSEQKATLFRSAVQRIDDICQTLLEQGRPKSSDPQFSLQAVVLEIVAEKKSQVKNEIKVSIDGDLQVRGNATDFKRALSNLINNAAEASSPSSPVNISAKQVLGQILISIEDRGSGMPRDVLQKLRAGIETTFGKENGHGLGLQQVRTFVNDCNGRLAIDSMVDRGTVVTMILP